MRSTAGRYAVRTCAFLAVLAASALLSGRVVASFTPAAPPVDPWSGVYTEEKLEEATERFTGRVSAGLLPRLRGETTLAVVIDADDLEGCEDLGRQLRELRRTVPGRTIAVWTAPGDAGDLRRFLARERVSDVAVEEVEGPVLDGRALATPAALLVERDGAVVQGIAHTIRFPNMRLRSFAQELTLLAEGG